MLLIELAAGALRYAAFMHLLETTLLLLLLLLMMQSLLANLSLFTSQDQSRLLVIREIFCRIHGNPAIFVYRVFISAVAVLVVVVGILDLLRVILVDALDKETGGRWRRCQVYSTRVPAFMVDTIWKWSSSILLFTFVLRISKLIIREICMTTKQATHN